MRMTFATLKGLALSRLASWKSAPPAAVDVEVNNAAQQVWLQMRDQGNGRGDRSLYLDLVADQDLYPLPTNVGEVKNLERMDRGQLSVPMVPVTRGERAYRKHDSEHVGGVGNQYEILPGRVVHVLSKPTTSTPNGLRVWFTPGYVPMVAADDYPEWLPEPVHEAIVPLAVKRLSQYAGVEIADPAAFKQYASEWERLLIQYLEPEEGDLVPDVQDFDQFYA